MHSMNWPGTEDTTSQNKHEDILPFNQRYHMFIIYLNNNAPHMMPTLQKLRYIFLIGNIKEMYIQTYGKLYNYRIVVVYVDNDSKNDRKAINKKKRTRRFYVKNLYREKSRAKKEKFTNIEKRQNKKFLTTHFRPSILRLHRSPFCLFI